MLLVVPSMHDLHIISDFILLLPHIGCESPRDLLGNQEKKNSRFLSDSQEEGGLQCAQKTY